MGIGRTLGGVAGGIGGFFAGGPGGAMLGYAGGSALGGAIEDEEESRNRETGTVADRRNPLQYGGAGADAEADRASALGAAAAGDTRFLGRQLGGDADSGKYNSYLAQKAADTRAGGLYGDAAGSMGRAGAADAAQTGARGDTMAAIGRLRSFYEQGPGPSAAQAQLRQGQDSANRNAMSLAATGGGGAAARRAALRTSAAGNQQANQAAGTLRAQEAAQWRQTQLGAMGQEQNALAGVRAGDMGAMGQHIGAAGQQYGAAGQAAATGVGHAQVGAQYGAQGNQARLGAEGMAIGQNQFGEQQRSGILGNQLGADTSRYAADKGVSVGMAQVAQRDRAADMAMTGSLIGAGADMYSRQMSDVRAKENIRPVSAASLVSRVDALGGGPDLRQAGGYAYDYVDPKYGRDGQVGPMAQELEQTDARGAVSTGPDGMKSVDPNRLTMTNTSAIAEQQRRLDRLEAMAADETGDDWQPSKPATQGQRTIRKTEAVEGRRMGEAEKRAMATFGNIGSIKPEDEEYIRQTTPKRSAASGGGGSARIRVERY